MGEDTIKAIHRVTFAGLLINLVLVVVKYLAGWFGHSEALLADATHSATDAVTDIAVIIGAFFWAKPPDEGHPYGHQRIETLVTLFIGGLLIAASIALGIEAVGSLLKGERQHPLPMAAGAAFISIVLKEFLYRLTRKVAIKTDSSALMANAWHHRLDAFSSIPAFLAVSLAIFFPGLLFLDSVASLLIAVFIAQAAAKIIWPNIREIMAAGASPETCSRIREEAMKHPEVLDVHDIRTRFLGTRLFVEFHMVVNGDLTVREGHDISVSVKKDLLSRNRQMEDIVIHLDPG